MKKLPGFRRLTKADRQSVEKLAKGEIDEMPPKAEDEGERNRVNRSFLSESLKLAKVVTSKNKEQPGGNCSRLGRDVRTVFVIEWACHGEDALVRVSKQPLHSASLIERCQGNWLCSETEGRGLLRRSGLAG